MYTDITSFYWPKFWKNIDKDVIQAILPFFFSSGVSLRWKKMDGSLLILKFTWYVNHLYILTNHSEEIRGEEDRYKDGVCGLKHYVIKYYQ